MRDAPEIGLLAKRLPASQRYPSLSMCCSLSERLKVGLHVVILQHDRKTSAKVLLDAWT